MVVSTLLHNFCEQFFSEGGGRYASYWKAFLLLSEPMIILFELIWLFCDIQVVVAYAMTVVGILSITLPLYEILGVMILMHAVWGFHGVMYDASKNKYFFYCAPFKKINSLRHVTFLITWHHADCHTTSPKFVCGNFPPCFITRLA